MAASDADLLGELIEDGARRCAKAQPEDWAALARGVVSALQARRRTTGVVTDLELIERLADQGLAHLHSGKLSDRAAAHVSRVLTHLVSYRAEAVETDRLGEPAPELSVLEQLRASAEARRA